METERERGKRGFARLYVCRGVCVCVDAGGGGWGGIE